MSHTHRVGPLQDVTPLVSARCGGCRGGYADQASEAALKKKWRERSSPPMECIRHQNSHHIMHLESNVNGPVADASPREDVAVKMFTIDRLASF